MSRAQTSPDQQEKDDWEILADKQELLEMIVEEDRPFAKYAERLLDGLERRGYR